MALNRLATLFTALATFQLALVRADVVTYDWHLTPITTSFNGVVLETLGVNDTPGEKVNIEVELGQEVELRVTNDLLALARLGTQEMDGVSGFTQCFINPNTTAVYQFTPGTFWRHSHHKTQYAFGLRGPRIVHAPESDLRECEEEIDEEYIVQLADIYHTAPTFGPALWDTIAINNRGRFDCTAAAINNNLTECYMDQPWRNIRRWFRKHEDAKMQRR